MYKRQALERNKSHSRECEAKIKLNYSLRQESECDNAVDRCSPIDIQKPADNPTDKIADNGGAPDEEITAVQRKQSNNILNKYEKRNRENLITVLVNIYPDWYDQRVNGGVFKNNNCYLLFHVCKIQIHSGNVLSVSNEMYKHLRSPYNYKNEYVHKVFDEYLGKQSSFVPKAGAFEEKHTGKVNSDRRSELSE